MFSTIPLLDGTFEWDVLAALDTSIVGGVDGKVGKSSSSRPGGFGCSEVKLFLKGSEGLGLYDLLASDTGSVESESDERIGIGGDIGASLTEPTGGGVKTSKEDDEDDDEDDDDDEEEEEVDGTGTVDADTDIDADAAAATAANSSSAFLIRSKSLKVLNVLLLSLGTSSGAFSDWLILEEDEGEYLSGFG